MTKVRLHVMLVLCDSGTIKCEEEKKKKKRGTTEYDKSTVTYDVDIAQCEDRIIKCDTTECEKSTVKCYVNTAQCDNRAIKCEKK